MQEGEEVQATKHHPNGEKKNQLAEKEVDFCILEEVTQEVSGGSVSETHRLTDLEWIDVYQQVAQSRGEAVEGKVSMADRELECFRPFETRNANLVVVTIRMPELSCCVNFRALAP